jgi:hypothetical protein
VREMKIKRKIVMNEKELIKYLVDHDNTTIRFSGISYDGAWLSIEPEIESKVHFEFKDASTFEKTFTVEVEEEITEDTVIPQIIGVLQHIISNGKVAGMHYDKSVNEIIKGNYNNVSEYETSTLHILNDDGTHTLIWRDGRLVE